MTKKELAVSVKAKLDCTNEEAEEVTAAVLESLVSGIQNDGHVILTGFGVFDVRTHHSRKGRNPRTGEVIEIPEYKDVGFRLAANLLQKL